MRYAGFAVVVFTLALGVALMYTHPARSQPARITEYKVIVGSYSGLGSEPLRAGVQNALNEEVKAGWELVQAISLPSPFTANMMLILKR